MQTWGISSDIARLFCLSDCINPADFSYPIQDVIVDMTEGGVDCSFECIGDVGIMRLVA